MASVFVSSQGEAAQSDPQFIIKMGGVYYLTRAIWQYDFDLATTDDQRDGVAEIANEFADLPENPDIQGVRLRPPGPGGGDDPNQTPPQNP
jgi:hypothetical protein